MLLFSWLRLITRFSIVSMSENAQMVYVILIEFSGSEDYCDEKGPQHNDTI